MMACVFFGLKCRLSWPQQLTNRKIVVGRLARKVDILATKVRSKSSAYASVLMFSFCKMVSRSSIAIKDSPGPHKEHCAHPISSRLLSFASPVCIVALRSVKYERVNAIKVLSTLFSVTDSIIFRWLMLSNALLMFNEIVIVCFFSFRVYWRKVVRSTKARVVDLSV